MATIDATVGGANANSYVDVAEATTLMETHALNSHWVNNIGSAQEVNQTNALIEATRMLDEYTAYQGVPVNDTQALRWPRTGVVDKDDRTVASDIIPVPIKRATAVLATELIRSNIQAPRDDEGIASVSVAGAVAVTFDKADKKEVIPETVRSILRGWGTVAGGMFIPVVRG